MAKPIYMDGGEIEQLLREVKQQLLGLKCPGGVDIKKDFAKDNRRAVIYFTPGAWNRMTALVSSFNTEVQWHGCVRRLGENVFEVYDIIVPPHVVTGSTVTSDPVRYSEWITGLGDEVFSHLRFHGHSHVNMGCSPSGTDMKYRRDIVTQLPIPRNEDEDSFYLFLIVNKKGEWTGEIYDVTNNALYGNGEIEIEVYDKGDSTLSTFISEAKKLAVKETPAPVTVPITYDVGRYCEDWYEQAKGAKKNGKKGKTVPRGYEYGSVQEL